MTLETVARRLREAASTDAALESALSHAYQGRHDVQDALWWRAHPLTDTPAGRTDPAAALAGLQAAVYSRARPTEPLGESERRLQELLGQLAQDAADLDLVLDRFGGGLGALAGTGAPATPGTSMPGTPVAASRLAAPAAPATPATPVTPETPDTTVTPATVAAPDVRRPPRRGLRDIVLLLTAGVAVGVLAVLGVQSAGAPGRPVSATGDPRTSTPEASVAAGVLKIFGQPDIPDQTPLDLGPAFRRDSIHAVFVLSEIGYVVYAARRGDALYCLVLRSTEQIGVSTCVGLEQLSRQGIVLNATVPDGDSSGGLRDVTVTWSPDGMISGSTGPHVTP